MSFSPTARSWVCLQGLSRSTKRCGWFLICCLFLSACFGDQVEDRWCGNRTLESGDLIVLNTDFGSSSVDVARPRCEGRWEALLLVAVTWPFAWGNRSFTPSTERRTEA